MSDVFVSYASADRDRVRMLVDVLSTKGWSVWWDREAMPGVRFDELIDKELLSAKCVVVAWSEASTSSRWVRAEAAQADERGILVPVLIADVMPPLEFRRVQASQLLGWAGQLPHPEVTRLLDSVAAMIGRTRPAWLAARAGLRLRAEPSLVSTIGYDRRLHSLLDVFAGLSETESAATVRRIRELQPRDLGLALLWRDPDRFEDHQSLRGLAAGMDAEGVGGPIARLFSDDVVVAQQAVRDVDERRLESCAGVLAALLLDENTPYRVQRNAAAALASLGQAALHDVLWIVGATDSRRVEAVVAALQPLSEQVLAAVHGGLNSSSPLVRRGASIIAEHFPDSSLERPLEEATRDIVSDVADRAKRSLRSVRIHRGTVARFRPTSRPGFRIIGGGEIGGKASNLAYLFEEIEGGHLPDASAFVVPPSVVIGTAEFDVVIGRSGLTVDLDDLSPAAVAERFCRVPFSSEVVEDLRKLLPTDRPLVLRSSSLLEGTLRHSLAGIYRTVWIPPVNASIEQSLTRLHSAVRLVQASVWSEDAKAYRRKLGLELNQEKMAVLIQPAVGRRVGQRYYPLASGIGLSRNFYPWSGQIRANDKLVRMVYGLGTAAVGRGPAFLLSPGHSSIVGMLRTSEDVLAMCQRQFDYIDLNDGEVRSDALEAAIPADEEISLVAQIIRQDQLKPILSGSGLEPAVVTFASLLDSDLLGSRGDRLAKVIDTLEDVFGYEIAMEFALDQTGAEGPGPLRVNVLQVRPLEAEDADAPVDLPQESAEEVLISAEHALGNGAVRDIHYVVMVVPEKPIATVAASVREAVRRVNIELGDDGYMLVGPGWWGTLLEGRGVPVSYADISNARVVIEIVGELPSEPSFGGHLISNLLAGRVPLLTVTRQAAASLRSRLLQTENTIFATELIKVFCLGRAATAAVDGRRRRGKVFFAKG